MTPMSFDFSRKPELTSLAHVVRDLHKVAQPMGTAFFLIGAAARDQFRLMAGDLGADVVEASVA
jgi:hypothetical protein